MLNSFNIILPHLNTKSYTDKNVVATSENAEHLLPKNKEKNKKLFYNKSTEYKNAKAYN